MIKFITSFELYPTMNSWNQSNGYSINMKIHNLPLRSHEKDALYTIIGDEGLSSEFYSRLDDDIENWRWENKELLGTFRELKYWEGKGWLHSENKEDIKTVKEILKRNLDSESRTKFENFMAGVKTSYGKNGTSVYGAFKEYREQIYFDAGFNGRSGGHLVLYRWNGHNFSGTGWNHDKEDLKAMNKEEVREIYKILRAFESLSDTLIETARAFSHEEVEDEEYTIKKTRKVFKNQEV